MGALTAPTPYKLEARPDLVHGVRPPSLAQALALPREDLKGGLRCPAVSQVMASPDAPDKDAAVLDFDAKPLKDAKDIITQRGLEVRVENPRSRWWTAH
jgi:hypothetical protein